MTSVLSPLSPPFHPTKSMESSMIFNDGIPSLMSTGADVIRGFSDDAIDECFPPTAEEVAEMDAVDYFVNTLAILDLMEEREERIRLDMSTLPKRWAVRRELRGKPHPARSEIPSKGHHVSHEDEIKLVVYDKMHRSYEKTDRRHTSQHAVIRANKKLNSWRVNKPIQQPRK
mmetsp:Transcript_27744/g.40955  ORF Transcript_27744/g.40955 Transcript_27744/m.40955 type:complete len:172 (-) Transcript_27744:83-598(-)|eukprot:CAMPEP_0194201304 /NCGR_PEP_ID=MMETSP0156-20130528/1594_1 /TAXON_ID=33649 /ORGANISM="Thalassionema nitzschioides, Strain L26-B" /LENGTH=171 /DNA_ID=CAMNT_0038926453 /DNA_START=69 /DNA_END=584 /DNA_ORIENTATION=+